MVELPREVVERLLPLLPACTVLRAGAVCRCGPERRSPPRAHVDEAASRREGWGYAGGEGRGSGGQRLWAASVRRAVSIHRKVT